MKQAKYAQSYFNDMNKDEIYKLYLKHFGGDKKPVYRDCSKSKMIEDLLTVTIDVIALTKEEYKAIDKQVGCSQGLRAVNDGFKDAVYSVEVDSVAHAYYLDFIADGKLEHHNKLIQSVKDAFTTDGVWFHFKSLSRSRTTRLPKGLEASEFLVNSPFVEVVDYHPYMTPNLGFSSEEALNEFIDKVYFVRLTDVGAAVFAMRELYVEALSKADAKHRDEIKDVKQNIAKNLLSSIGIDFDDLTNDNDWD